MTTNVFFISDMHFFHKRILEFQAESGTRIGTTLDEMHHELIQAWNRVVPAGGVVYNLGDVSFGRPGESVEILRQLKGQHHLIIGNHDEANLRDSSFRECFASINHVKKIKVKEQKIWLSHFAHREWDGRHRGTWHLFGHSHGRTKPYGKSFDVGVDGGMCRNMEPVSFDRVYVCMQALEMTARDGN